MPGEGSVIPDVFFRQVSKQGDRPALRYKRAGIWQKITWGEYGRMVKEVGAGLLSFNLEKAN